MSRACRLRYGVPGALALLARASVALRTPAITGRLGIDNTRIAFEAYF